MEVVEQLIEKRNPTHPSDSGGQAGPNSCHGACRERFPEEHNVRPIGTTAETIKKAEDRLEFKETMEKIGEPLLSWLLRT